MARIPEIPSTTNVDRLDLARKLIERLGIAATLPTAELDKSLVKDLKTNLEDLVASHGSSHQDNHNSQPQ